MEKRIEKGKRGWADRVQGGVCLFLISLGMSYCLESILAIWIPWQARLSISLLLTVFVEILELGLWQMVSGSLIFVGALTFVCMKYNEILFIGLKEVLNRALELINAYHRTEYLLWYLETKENYDIYIIMLIVVVLGFFEGLLLFKTKHHKFHVLAGAILPVFIITAGLMVGWAASFVGILLVFAGLLIEIFDIRERGNVLFGILVTVSIAIPILFVSNERVWNQVKSLREDWLHSQLAFEDRLLAVMEKITDSPLFLRGEQFQYALSNEKPNYTGDEVFRITADYPVSSPVYLRGFVGGAYENGTWKRISRQEFSDWAQSLGSDEQTYAKIVQSFPYEFASKYAVWAYMRFGRDKHVSLQLKQSLERYTLTPYVTKIPEDKKLQADGIFPPEKATEYEWDSFLNINQYDILTSEKIYLDEYNLEYMFADDTLKEEMKKKIYVWNNYQNYVQKTYTGLPEEGLRELRDYVTEQKQSEKTYEEVYDGIWKKLDAIGDDVWEFSQIKNVLTEEELKFMTGDISEKSYIMQNVLNALWKDNRYSFDLDKVPAGRDDVEYFMFEQHKGFCTHFASAATLLLRMNGIPARYATGYLVVPSDFKKNEDGTWTAVVTDERAHAWTEVFYDNLGFCPVETTPPQYIEILEDMGEEQTLTDAIAQKDREYEARHPETKKEQEEVENKQEEAENKQEEEKRDENPGNIGNVKRQENSSGIPAIFDKYRSLWVGIGLAVSAIVGICFFLWLRRRLVLKERQKRFTGENRTCAVCEIGKELGKILKLLGKERLPGMDDREYQVVLMQEFSDEDWEQSFLVFRKARFSECGVTEKEYSQVLVLYQNMEQKLVSISGFKGWYMRYMKIYS